MVSRRCSAFVTIVDPLVLQSEGSPSPDPEKLKGEMSPSVVTSPSSRFLLKALLYRRLGPRVVFRIAHRVTRRATSRTAVSPIFDPARQLQRSCRKVLTLLYAIPTNTRPRPAKVVVIAFVLCFWLQLLKCRSKTKMAHVCKRKQNGGRGCCAQTCTHRHK